MSRYMDIGEVVITSPTISGKVNVRIVHRRGMRRLVWLLLVATVLALAAAFLLQRGRHQEPVGAPAGQELDQPQERQPAPTSEEIPQKQPDQPPERAEENKPKAISSGGQKPDSLSAQQRAENALQNAQQLAQDGKINEAVESYRESLLLEPANDSARKAMIDLLLRSRRTADAESVLQLGLKYSPKQTSYAMQLARLQAGRNDLPLALDTMMKGLPYAGQQPDYQAFIASLLQRLDRHQSAVVYYKKALELKPNSGEWLMGLGISLKADRHAEEARDAFRRALDSQTLSPKSQAFVEDQLKQP